MKPTIVASENFDGKLFKIASTQQILKFPTGILVYHPPFRSFVEEDPNKPAPVTKECRESIECWQQKKRELLCVNYSLLSLL